MSAFIFQDLNGLYIALTVVYSLMALFAYKQLMSLYVSPVSSGSIALNTKKLFVMTCLLTATLRVMSFVSMIVLSVEIRDFHYDIATQPSPNSDSGFLEEALLVLFDFPDFCCISAYMLLIVVWAEAYLKSRRHWLSSYRFRQAWILLYLIANILLYTAQVTLYSLLFLPDVSQGVETVLIYYTLAIFNLGLPLLWILAYLYLEFQFAGFPFSTNCATLRLQYLSYIGILWSTTRLLWGAITLVAAARGWLGEVRKTKIFYTLILILVFMVVEVVPILVTIQPKVLPCLAEEGFHVDEQEIILASHSATSNYYALPTTYSDNVCINQEAPVQVDISYFHSWFSRFTLRRGYSELSVPTYSKSNDHSSEQSLQ